MELLTEADAGTYINPRGEDTTIDLAWATQGGWARYKGSPELRGSDHLPQLASIGGRPYEYSTGGTKLNWKLMDREKVAAAAGTLPVAAGLDTKEGLDTYVDKLTDAI